MPSSWTISDLFARCADLSAAERESFLATLEADQAEIVARVRKLLAAHDRAPGVLEGGAIDQVKSWTGSEETGEPASGAARRLRSRPRAFWIFIALDLLGIAFYVFCGLQVARYKSQVVDWGYDTDLKSGIWRVISLDPHGPAAGKLADGDVILNVNDRKATATSVLAEMQSIRAQSEYRLTVARNGVPREVKLTLGVRENPKRPGDIVTFGMVSLAFFATAVILGLLKSEQTIAQRGYVALITEGLVLAKVLIFPYAPFFDRTTFVIYETYSLLDGVHFVFGYLFYCTLFERVIAPRAWKIPLYIMAPWAVIITLFRVAIECGWTSSFFDRHFTLLEWVMDLDPLFYLFAPISICAVIARNYVRVRQPDERRRAKWIAYGSLAGILPYILFRVVRLSLETWGNQWATASDPLQEIRRLSILAAMLIPAATGYAIYKHRMFDISVAVRRGVRYMLAKSVLQAALALPALALAIALVRNAQRTVADAILSNAAFIVLLILLAGVLRFRIPLRRWLDRQFFRESYRREQLLLSLVDSVQKLQSLSEMAETVGESIDAAFHPESIAIFYHSPKDRFYTVAYSAGSAGNDLRIRENSPLLAVLEGDAEARQLASIAGIPAAEMRRFEALGTDLIVPMTGAARGIAGLILLGRKLADEPYTTEDRRLLGALAGQMAMAHENISLHQMLEDQRKTAEDIRARLETGGVDGFRECPECGACYDLSVLRCPGDGAEPAFALPIRRTVDRYRLERRIGKGGMGAVYEAEDLSLRRRVAIKVMTGARLENAASLHRIYREARAAARLNHPNIITTYDFGVANAVAYLVMELIHGETLRQATDRGAIDGPTAAEWFDQILAGVEAAHAAGIVHRDLKPENVLISPAPLGGSLIKILDFGIAKTDSQRPESTDITSPGTVLGSIQYMSPEQLSGGKVDARSDLFSIGVMVFEVLAGKAPFSGSTYTERLISVLHDPVIFPEGMPEDLRAALDKCLAKDPAGRFASAAEVRRELVPRIGMVERALRADWGSGAG